MSEIPKVDVVYRIQNVDSRLYLERSAIPAQPSVPQMRPEDSTSKRQHVRHYSVFKQNPIIHVHSVEGH